jgi:small nuclear ribonucleoprotein (snRNP)-like protein
MVYAIDAHLNKQLIIETNNEGRVYKAILKHLDIKLNHHGDIIKTPTKAR